MERNWREIKKEYGVGSVWYRMDGKAGQEKARRIEEKESKEKETE